MQTILATQDLNELINRIQSISSASAAEWGKMNAHQMVKHCILSERMYLGEDEYKRTFIGKLFGRMALKSILKDAAPLQKNQPTHPDFAIAGLPTGGALETDKQSWIALLKRYAETTEADFTSFVHPFFGRMNREQVGRYVYKHTDHHLRQFGC